MLKNGIALTRLIISNRRRRRRRKKEEYSAERQKVIRARAPSSHVTARGRLLYGPRALLKDHCNIDLLTQEMCFKKRRGEQKEMRRPCCFPWKCNCPFAPSVSSACCALYVMGFPAYTTKQIGFFQQHAILPCSSSTLNSTKIVLYQTIHCAPLNLLSRKNFIDV